MPDAGTGEAVDDIDLELLRFWNSSYFKVSRNVNSYILLLFKGIRKINSEVLELSKLEMERGSSY